MPNPDSVLAAMRAICLSLPDTKETPTWGKPHFRVNDKIFAGCHEEDGRSVIGFKLEMQHAAAVLADPRFTRAPYVGHKGWVSMDASRISDWGEVRELILESYRLIAPKRSLAKLAEASGESPNEARAPRRGPKPKKASKRKAR